MEQISEIEDTVLLSKMLDECEDPDQRTAIRARLREMRKKGREAAEKRLKELETSSQQRIKDKVTEGIQHRARTLATYDEMQKTGKLNLDTYKGTITVVDEDTTLRKSPARAVGGIASLSTKATPHVMSQAAKGNIFKQMDAQTVANKSPASGPSSRSPSSIKDALLRWCQIKTKEYDNVNIVNFSSSWADGMAFCALIHHFCPHAFDYKKLDPKNRKGNFELAFQVAEKEADIVPLLDVDDMLMMGDKPDWKCVFTYVQSFYRRFRDEK